jgi:hypothetical protein
MTAIGVAHCSDNAQVAGTALSIVEGVRIRIAPV